jgi:hypothetical protein
VQTVTSSIVYSSGSNLFGSALTDRQTFTGSVNITGSQTVFGNVGIGTTNPGQKIQVRGTNENAIVRIETTGSGNPSVTFTTLNQQDWGIGVDYNDSGKLKFDGSTTVAAATKMTLTNSGLLGIGTTNPSLTLHVNKSSVSGAPATSGTTPTGYAIIGSAFNNNLYMGSYSSVSYGFWMQAQDATVLSTTYPIMLNPNGGSVGVGVSGSVGHALSVNGAVAYYYGSAPKWHIQYASAADGLNFVESSVADYRMFIKAGGNVGIGNSTPDFPLTVKTDASANSIKILGRSSGDTSVSWNSSDNATQYAHIDIGAAYSQLWSISSFQIFASTNQATGGAYNTFGNLYVASTSSQGIDIGGSISIGGKYNGSSYATFARIQGKKENSSSGQTGGYLAFEVNTDVTNNNTERMRISSTGAVVAGATGTVPSGTDNSAYLWVPAQKRMYISSDSAAATFCRTSTGGSGAIVGFDYNGGSAGNISTNGSTVTFSGTAVSDARYKEDIQPITNALEAINQVDFVTFKFKENGHNSAGVTSQQIQTIEKLAPFVIDGVEEAFYKAFDYNALVGYLGKAIQELKAEFDTYKETHP